MLGRKKWWEDDPAEKEKLELSKLSKTEQEHRLWKKAAETAVARAISFPGFADVKEDVIKAATPIEAIKMLEDAIDQLRKSNSDLVRRLMRAAGETGPAQKEP